MHCFSQNYWDIRGLTHDCLSSYLEDRYQSRLRLFWWWSMDVIMSTNSTFFLTSSTWDSKAISIFYTSFVVFTNCYENVLFLFYQMSSKLFSCLLVWVVHEKQKQTELSRMQTLTQKMGLWKQVWWQSANISYRHCHVWCVWHVFVGGLCR